MAATRENEVTKKRKLEEEGTQTESPPAKKLKSEEATEV
jgi:hypothetical protein